MAYRAACLSGFASISRNSQDLGIGGSDQRPRTGRTAYGHLGDEGVNGEGQSRGLVRDQGHHN
jgi:hypothetical protein